MAETGPGAAGGYVAFISYSHKDAAMGRWLHRKLEGYRLPKRLAGTQGEHGEVPARLTPIFRDRDELPAAGDLTETVRAALAISRNLIVLCSPDSAASPWVAKEIATFRELHPGRPIYTAIVEGEPEQCFAPALREGGTEPLAADLRKEADGRRLGLLKLVAGLAGVGLDALVQRDAQRRVRRVTYVTAAATVATIVMAMLTALAISARAEAERQRTHAEGLVEFMLTDLRDRLRGVGSLDVLTAVNQRALSYYQSQDLAGLPVDSLERRARILLAMGEDDQKKGLTDRALAQFREAARTTSTLLSQQPDDPQRIYDHAQSEFWVGYIDYARQNYAKARAPFLRYKMLADQLVSKEPNKPKWLREAAYAEGNLCTISLALNEPADVALAICQKALAHMERAAHLSGTPADYHLDLANRHAWLADALLESARPQEALDHRLAQERLLTPAIERDPSNYALQEIDLTAQLALASLEASRHRPAAARLRLERARQRADALVKRDPANSQWKERQSDVRRKATELGL